MTDTTSKNPEHVQRTAMPFRTFLEGVHPSTMKECADVWYLKKYPSGARSRFVLCPDIRLHCDKCDGEHWFRGDDVQISGGEENTPAQFFMTYTCSDCQRQSKLFSLHIAPQDEGYASVYKFGELPSFGIPVPNRVLKLFDGADAENFKKGRRCESQGLGIGAFSYYRRVVENHKNDIFDQIIKVCKKLNVAEDLVAELESAKEETQFTRSIESIRAALPQGLLIDGHNPLTALHSALSGGLHNESDADCLASARDIRIVLAALVERIYLLKEDNSELSSAVQRLIAKRVKD